ncbi:phosphoglycerate kinase [Aminivibrio pyruvatiphilus]|uniref:Phosphoglycerate kinase n=1 Tax=Aminivibrio pyruvatiphilus TaxID=1005740 RepID=A0A4R8M5Z2_9BACT|nr:phosphoglycerate kinase [Aminivibrio pyruvatiphilus]TDY56062.1 phosphoglycerate kinase [Aminivibrio pyruvatiphilus]
MKLRLFSHQDVAGKNVLLRVDFNVPVKNGEVGDLTRILAHRDTISTLLKADARVALCSHLGRPKGKKVPEMSLALVAAAAEKALGHPVSFCGECIGPEVEAALASLTPGTLLLLENLRFHPEEQENDAGFARSLASPFDVFVMDAFSAAHRADASTSAVMDILPSFSGFLLEREVNMLSAVSEIPEKPFVLILGGAKVSDKIGVVEHLMDKATSILIGGGMAFTFLKARGANIGRSLFESEKAGFALEMMEKAAQKGVEILLPVDVVAGASLDMTQGEQIVPADDIPEDLMGLDIGPKTAQLFASRAAAAKTVLWNGPMGVFENPVFAKGTRAVAEGVALSTKNGGLTVVGGGDTASAAKQLGFDREVSHVSTGGGASLEFCEGRQLPGIMPLVAE